MKAFRMRVTIRWMVVAVAVSALLIFLLAKTLPRSSIFQGTTYDPGTGITFRHSHSGPYPLGGTLGRGVGKTSKGTSIHWASWTDGLGRGELVEFEEESMRLRSGGREYGPIDRGDLVDFGLGEIRINGIPRMPRPAQTIHNPPRWAGRNLVPGDLVVPD